MPNLQKARETHQKIVGLLKELEHHLSETTEVPNLAVQEIKSVVADPNKSLQKPAVADEPLDSFESLKKALSSTKWPEAVNPHLICSPDSVDDKMERGKSILELFIEQNLKGLKFLDYGCGEGQCTALTADLETVNSVGYDLKEDRAWATYPAKSNLLYTTDFAKVQEQGPYDVILLYDVIDHIVNEDPAVALTKLASLLSPKGNIYMRTHPFVSRHGTHLYHELNKAYVHLVFTPEELKQLVPNSKYAEPSIGVTTPIMTYDGFINAAGLKVVNKRDITEKVEPFFKIPKIAERIMKNLNKNNFPEFQMSIQFIDYVLAKK